MSVQYLAPIRNSTYSPFRGRPGIRLISTSGVFFLNLKLLNSIFSFAIEPAVQAGANGQDLKAMTVFTDEINGSMGTEGRS